jgi:hypothetical protein
MLLNENYIYANICGCSSNLISIIVNCMYYILVTSKMSEEFEDTKGVIRICKSKKNRQHNGRKKKDK